jgi:Caspase domain
MRWQFSVVWAVVTLALAGCGDSFNPRGSTHPLAGAHSALPRASLAERDPTVVALLIAVQERDPAVDEELGLPPLRYVSNDAKAIAAVLHDSFGVPAENIYQMADEQATSAAVSAMMQELAGIVRKGDTVVVAFLGHGIRSRGQSRLVFYDAAVGLTSLMNQIERLSTDRVLFLADACRAGDPLGERFVINDENFDNVKTIAWFSSSGADELAYESDELQHGVFSYQLVRALSRGHSLDENHDGWLNLEEIAEPVSKQVQHYAETVARVQTPRFGVVRARGRIQLLPLPNEWALQCMCYGTPAQVAVKIPAKLDAGRTPWLLVQPLASGELYWPQEAVGPQALSYAKVYLGHDGRDIGGRFRILLVDADVSLDQRFRSTNEGLSWPPIDSLPLRAEETVTRQR